MVMTTTPQSVGDVIAGHLTEIHRLANEHAAALTSLKEAAAEAAADQVPTSGIAAAAGVTRSTVYAWLGQ